MRDIDGGQSKKIPRASGYFFLRKAGNKPAACPVYCQLPPRAAQYLVMGGEDPRSRFDNVVVPHLADAFALARWLAGNRTDAEDIVQEACLRAFKSIDGYHGGNARAWLLTIVRRTAYSWLEKHRSLKIVATEDLKFRERAVAEQGADMNILGAATPEAQLIANADAALLELAITQLPIEFRETLVLRDIQGLGYREIAEVTATPIGTVMSRLARARRKLIDAVEKE
jgi:RNA polymerase sigma-70 factor, ECF subfamily